MVEHLSQSKPNCTYHMCGLLNPNGLSNPYTFAHITKMGNLLAHRNPIRFSYPIGTWHTKPFPTFVIRLSSVSVASYIPTMNVCNFEFSHKIKFSCQTNTIGMSIWERMKKINIFSSGLRRQGFACVYLTIGARQFYLLKNIILLYASRRTRSKARQQIK